MPADSASCFPRTREWSLIGAPDVPVTGRDRLYFRVNRGADSGFDTTNWDPQITYQ